MVYDEGVVYGGSGKLLGIQVFGSLIIVCWSALINLPLFFLLRHFKVLRIPLDAQLSVHVRPCSHPPALRCMHAFMLQLAYWRLRCCPVQLLVHWLQ